MPRFGDLAAIHPGIPHPDTLTPADLGWRPNPPAADLCSWWRAEYRETSRFLGETYPLLPRQVIHGDFAPSNTLWDRDRISAIPDFEFALPEIRGAGCRIRTEVRHAHLGA